mmetsp:Transcript_8990/g.11041  ORF Transcript_8990/g.11041 Transcript_8990/m.11041 type:complete len:161 (+) Transcript_8990:73-555(+)
MLLECLFRSWLPSTELIQEMNHIESLGDDRFSLNYSTTNERHIQLFIADTFSYVDRNRLSARGYFQCNFSVQLRIYHQMSALSTISAISKLSSSMIHQVIKLLSLHSQSTPYATPLVKSSYPLSSNVIWAFFYQYAKLAYELSQWQNRSIHVYRQLNREI